jgi:hypothetical protein
VVVLEQSIQSERAREVYSPLRIREGEPKRERQERGKRDT